MNRNRAIFFVVSLLLIATMVAAIKLWPKQYMVATTMPEAIVFWNDDDAFVFLSLSTTGRAQNVFQEKLAATKYGYLSLFLENYIGFNKHDVVAYRLAADGRLSRFPLREGTVLYGSWSLADGGLQLAPPPVIPNENISFPSTLGFRWDGAKFVPVSSPPQPAKIAAETKLNADDDEDEDADYGFLNQSARKQFKASGWHYKLLTGYGNGVSQATLPFTLAGSTFNLTVDCRGTEGAATKVDFLMLGAKAIRLSGAKLESGPQVLWSQSGWQPLTKAEYEILKQKYGRRYQSPFTWTWLAIVALLLVWRFGSWFHLLFAFGTMKGRILKNMATSFSFPPATPAQFPALDTVALDRYTRELEGMGFIRLLDFSLTSDSPTHPPSFCRLLAHTRHHCFGTINQIFPRGKSPMPLRCSLEGCLQNGWTMAFSTRKPQAASSLIRRKRALNVCMPDATSSELLQAFLKMREQVCLDLGISPINDDSLEAFINKAQRATTEMREAVKEKSFIKGLPEVYLRKFSLLKTKPEYVWLGDYPKEAERRKQGLSSFATAGQ